MSESEFVLSCSSTKYTRFCSFQPKEGPSLDDVSYRFSIEKEKGKPQSATISVKLPERREEDKTRQLVSVKERMIVYIIKKDGGKDLQTGYEQEREYASSPHVLSLRVSDELEKFMGPHLSVFSSESVKTTVGTSTVLESKNGDINPYESTALNMVGSIINVAAAQRLGKPLSRDQVILNQIFQDLNAIATDQ
ncbi:hypothetical protein A2291_06370 [candidate division WOR-1 bacterium RIFOXYB2_FULL_42_35]|uniref:Uncharacterized protein n=1 Tax=candidate division WOR-1 bacterium RIFOXYC2_FULL_41_25 TaxID=1802586 RepID=A0A1F4TRX9_UNCSA|nr:MAG: hypothetical protein A2247_00075 [candidate division WOR-1 bacterium RIFOXYA2_FULL_41_14]OGC27399.1 MAG: hypothetical protein A2291_06370 [candidate division WOR-1 bacterium RIFOXYB2_FULL_42_35]OGC35438.1 MAG: hypothetical protein A2462_03030 [candidate division WOR-1 bacterium RIFOXYC2_FULL_41_25]OGC43789.1 MAG: hypothetical protein A2548_07935 [candidate division WOR-1 bacterium RIFOXYD2_FULL_41_8]